MLNRRSFCAAVAALFSPLSSLLGQSKPSTINSDDVEFRSVTFARELPAAAVPVLYNGEVIGRASNIRHEGGYVMADLHIQEGCMYDVPAGCEYTPGPAISA